MELTAQTVREFRLAAQPIRFCPKLQIPITTLLGLIQVEVVVALLAPEAQWVFRVKKVTRAILVTKATRATQVTLGPEARKVCRERLAEMVSTVKMELLALEVKKAQPAPQAHLVLTVSAAHKVSKAKLVQWELEVQMDGVCQQVERPVST